MQSNTFDQHAINYDVEFTYTEIGIAQRSLVHQYVVPKLNSDTNLLELNAGTGYDAIAFSKTVNKITATDASENMIHEIESKINKHHIQNIITKQISFNQIEQLYSVEYNFVFSNFGGLNCLMPNEWNNFSEKLFSLTKQKSKLIFVIMGKKCVWHTFLKYFIKGFKKLESRNQNKAVKLNASGVEINVRFYSPQEIKDFMGLKFKCTNLKPIGFCIPPSFTQKYFNKHSYLLKFLIFLDKSLFRFSFLADFSDHYLIEFERL